jgi:hypothetical protein
MATKVCSKCGIEKDVSEFQKNNHNRDGLRGWCRSCGRKYIDEHIEEKREYERTHRKTDVFRKKRNEYDKHHHQTPQYKKYQKEYNSRDYVREKRSKKARTPETRAKNKKWRDDNADWRTPKQQTYSKEYNQRVEVKIKSSLRVRVKYLIKKGDGNKYYSLMEIIGCDVDTFKKHIESLFTEGMNWTNYGQGHDKWNIDHIIPCVMFDMKDPEQQKACFNYKNLQPLWQDDNFSKNSFHNGVLQRKKSK